MFVPEGRKGRTMIVVDVRRTPSTRTADIFLQIRPGKDFEVITALRALIKGRSISQESLEETGLTLEQLQDLVGRMKRARFGAIFFGMGLTMTRGKHMNTSAILALGIEMNKFTRFVAMPLRGHGNVTGADAVSTWMTAYPFGVDFSRGYPRYNPGEFTAVDLLCRGDVDTVMVLGADPGATMPGPAIAHMARVPTIVLDPKVSHTSRLARVHITTAPTGISAPGTIYRMDDIPLQLRPVLKSPYPTDEQVIKRIHAAFNAKRSAETKTASSLESGSLRTPNESDASSTDAVCLKLKENLGLPLEAEVLSPDIISGLDREKILKLPVFLGNRQYQLSDFFDVEGEKSNRLELHGNLAQVKWIGHGMSGGSVVIHGNAGMHLGGEMKGGSITVHGNAGDWLGAEMTGGHISIRGNAGGQVGAAYRGSRKGMRGGMILIDGTAGIEIGMRMRRGLICVREKVGDFAGLQMLGGTMLLCGKPGLRTGAWMSRGTIVSLEPLKLLPTFQYACTYEPGFLLLLLKQLRDLGVPLPTHDWNMPVLRFTGDTSGLGKGEILVCRKN
jgi:formylmethanofuran dehydrogenase subunit B